MWPLLDKIIGVWIQAVMLLMAASIIFVWFSGSRKRN